MAAASQRRERTEERLDRIDLRDRARADLVVQANLVRHPAHDEGVGQLQQPVLMQLGKLNDAPLPPGMRFGNDQGKFIRAEAFVAQVRRMPGEESEANVHAAFLQRRLDLGG